MMKTTNRNTKYRLAMRNLGRGYQTLGVAAFISCGKINGEDKCIKTQSLRSLLMRFAKPASSEARQFLANEVRKIADDIQGLNIE